MYCKLYMHSASVETVISALESNFGTARNEHSSYFFKDFDISIYKNKEADANRLCTYPDGFLYYELIADMEIYGDHIRITAQILRLLWDHQMPAVVSCDYEDELNAYIFSL